MKNCQEITELISLNNEKKLAFNQRCAISIHLLFCPYCRAFKKNDQQIKRLMQEFKEK
ncbi:dsDNA-mimic protein [Canicola haemoglobinophilus]|uniref:DsDNA-mimic protein n=1 Tax=Canicola haemoglobinophilus TaxID=733 RepID=A0A377HWC2_9PAST|nr:zf-HC2 domain-containing protein [Canicola haemoglobinophilus]STO54324.1 dsDNA-mimic protein [Canicola haemoglobinophilus]STO60206.1 dsDNA-mimic protein [Canicola haemoglobinophilus]STO68858.1 dsDNA-mimic protein [Canicola haemoglobinophilus]